MRQEYDFSKSRKNPYAKRLKKQVTSGSDQETVDYFKGLAAESGIAYQILINLFLKQCANERQKPNLRWEKVPA